MAKVYRNKNSALHCEFGPAAEYDNGDKHWYVDGMRHRIDGPAQEYADGFGNVWCLNGMVLDKKFFMEERPDLISKMKAWELFTPDEIIKMRLTNDQR